MDHRSLSPSSSFDRLDDSDVEVGFSGATAPFPCYPLRRRGGLRSPRFFPDPLADDEPRHFLDSCALCRKPLAGDRDIYMYRGDTPFCSEECRQEQIEMDEGKEKKKKYHMSMMNSKEKKSSPSKSQKIEMRAAGGTAVAG